jgi:hypothetical protein
MKKGNFMRKKEIKMKKILSVLVTVSMIFTMVTALVQATGTFQTSYSIDQAKGVIFNIPNNTLVSVFKANFSVTGTSVVVTNGVSPVSDSAKIATGMTVSVADLTYTASVVGDATGDGITSVDDLAAIKSNILKASIFNDAKILANDIDNKGTITISDLLAVKKGLLGIGPVATVFGDSMIDSGELDSSADWTKLGLTSTVERDTATKLNGYSSIKVSQNQTGAGGVKHTLPNLNSFSAVQVSLFGSVANSVQVVFANSNNSQRATFTKTLNGNIWTTFNFKIADITANNSNLNKGNISIIEISYTVAGSEYVINIDDLKLLVGNVTTGDNDFNDAYNYTGSGTNFTNNFNSANIKTGNSSIKLYQADGVYRNYKYTFKDLIPGTQYTLTFYEKVIAVGSWIYMNNNDSANIAYVPDYKVGGVDANGWQKYSYNFTYAAGDVLTIMGYYNNQEVYYDDFAVVATPVADNSFENAANWSGNSSLFANNFDMNYVKSGSSSIKLYQTNDTWHYYRYTFTGLTAGRKYNLTFSEKKVVTGTWMFINNNTGDNFATAPYKVGDVDANGWQAYSVEFTYQTGDVLTIMGFYNQEVYYDDFSVTLVPSADNTFEDATNWSGNSSLFANNFDPAYVKTGYSSIKLYQNDGAWRYYRYTFTGLTAGKQYTLSFSEKSSTGGGWIYFNNNQDNIASAPYKVGDVDANGWQKYSVSFTYQTGDLLTIVGYYNQVCYYDEFQVTAPDNDFENAANWTGNSALFANNFDTNFVKTGLSSIKLYQTDGTWRYYRYTFTGLTAGNQYTLTFSEKVVTTGSWIYLNNNQDNIATAPYKVGDVDANGWQKYSYNFTYTAGDFLTIMGFYPQEVYYDEFIVAAPDNVFEDAINWTGNSALFANNFDPAFIKTGSSSIRLHQADGTWRYYNYTMTGLTVGNSYTLTYSSKSISPGNWVTFDNDTNSNYAVDLYKVGGVDANGWQTYAIPFTYQAGKTLTLMGYNNNQDIYFDGFVIS